MLGFANFGAKKYRDGIGWELRALNEKPDLIQPYAVLAACYVGANAIDKARAAFAEGQRRSPEFFRRRLEGVSFHRRPADRTTSTRFIRIAAGLENPGVADAQR
jgi:hypothetical protein